MKLIPGMTSFISAIPALTVILMCFVLPESSYHSNIIPHLYHTGLKIDGTSRMERPINIIIEVKVVCRDPVKGKLPTLSRIPPVDFDLQIIPNIDTIVCRMS
jgi:hypothetical protein